MRYPKIAAVLSIIPGLGQIVLGYTRRGAVLFFGLPLLALLLWAVGQTALIAGIIFIWVWGMYDAYLLARKQEPSISLPVAMALILTLIASWFITEVNVGDFLKNVTKNGGMITSQLLKPDLREIDKKETTVAIGTLDVYEGDEPTGAVRKPAESSAPLVTFEPGAAVPNEEITIKLSGFPADERVVLYRKGRDIALLELMTDSEGRAQTEIINPIQQSGTYSFDARIVKSTTTWKPSQTLRLTSAAVLQTVFMALLGTAISVLLAIPMSFFAARNLMKGSIPRWALYSATRLSFNVVRSFEVLVIAVVLVQIVGPGPFAGVLALAIHGVGAIGKLYSESIESIDRGPLEAITSTGASQLQVVIFGVIPQIVPQFVSFTMYRWDINVRMATVIGLVGGGGVGQLLIQYIGLTQWSRAATAIWMIAAVVMLMDYVSAIVREKLV